MLKAPALCTRLQRLLPQMSLPGSDAPIDSLTGDRAEQLIHLQVSSQVCPLFPTAEKPLGVDGWRCLARANP